MLGYKIIQNFLFGFDSELLGIQLYERPLCLELWTLNHMGVLWFLEIFSSRI